MSSIHTTLNGENMISQCCNPKSTNLECDPLKISQEDPLYGNFVRCIPHTRTLPSVPKDCKLGQREQANLATSFLDGSVIYGGSEKEYTALRSFQKGQMKLSNYGIQVQVLPIDEESGIWCQSKSIHKSCFKSGSKDVNMYPGVTALRTTLVKYHNYVVLQLRIVNPSWSDEKLFQEGKKIVVAQLQFITYHEFLPILLGKHSMIKFNLKLQKSGYDSNYDINVNPNTFNEVSIILTPLVMSMLGEQIRTVDEKGWITNDFLISEMFNDPAFIYEKDGIEDVLRFVTLEKIARPSIFVSSQFRGQYLINGKNKYGLDAIALALKQGRDHGIRGYRFYRQICGLPDISKVDDLKSSFYSDTLALKVYESYESIDDIELIIGALAEKLLRGSLLGPTLVCLLSKQFQNLKYGDRFWFENYFPDSSFALSQLNEIRKTSLAEILCKGSKLRSVQPHIFVLPDKFSNSFLNCQNSVIESLNFKAWKDDEQKIEMPVTMKTLEMVLNIAALNVVEQKKREGRNINSNQTQFKAGDPLFAWSSMMRPKEQSKYLNKIAEILLESTRILARGDILPDGQKLPKLTMQVIQKILPEIDVTKFIANYTAFLSDDGKASQEQCMPNKLPCDHTSRYRTYSGWCNNLNHQNYGNAFQPLKHLLPPVYEDGFDAPRSKAKSGKDLPSPRLISNKVNTDKDISHVKFTHMVMQFGQLVDHELTHSPTARGPNDEILNCTRCDSHQTISVHCHPIPVPANDPHFPPDKCLPFARSLLGQLNLGYRSQLNQLTSFADGSVLYGSTDCEAKQLRRFKSGLLKTSNIGHHNTEALPKGNQEKDCRSLPLHSCFVAGDERNSHQPGLTMMHTIFLREHNRIARQLASLNKHWNDEKVFQETRRIHVAQFQHIIFNEFIPKIIGMDLIKKHNLMVNKNGYFKGYDATCDAIVSQPFSTAAFRFGHTLIRRMFPRMDQNYHKKFEPVDLAMHFGHVEPIYNASSGGLDSLIMGLLGTPSMAFDRHITEAVRNHLFARRDEKTSGMDLISINILRARDHGVQTYNTFRNYCGLRKARTFSDLSTEMNEDAIEAMSSVYEDVDDIDLFVGLVSENPLRGALLGPTMACLVAEQFDRVKKCDRFYYENDNNAAKFTPEQLVEIKKIKLAHLFCQNSNYIDTIQPNVFDMPDDLLNAQMKCADFDRIDLSLWKEKEECQMKDVRIALGKTLNVTPCVSCTCTTEGLECHPQRITECEKLIKVYPMDNIMKDTSCVIQCFNMIKKLKQVHV
uniref:Peroxidase n=1 Tax=Rhabditophanes sp. KR3021 TaxID=114890 RepID=A0AC35U7B1_9BILA